MDGSPRRSTLLLSLGGGILASSTAAILIRFAQNEGAPSIVIAAARLTLATLFLAPFILSRHLPDLKTITRREWLLAMLSGIFLAIHFATWITSLEYTSIASSVVLVSTTPLWVALFSPIFLNERLGWLAIAGLLLALTGGTIIGMSDSCIFINGQINCPSITSFFNGKAFIGDMLALTGAWMAAGYLIIGRKLRTRISLMPYIFLVYGFAAVVLILFWIISKETLLGYPPTIYLWFILLALVPQLMGHTTINWLLKYLPASFVSVALLGEPIGSTLLAFIIFMEIPGLIKIVGAILILFGIWLVSRKNRDLNRSIN
jgi:drug/metabolite transporter (DMT)-like permease